MKTRSQTRKENEEKELVRIQKKILIETKKVREMLKKYSDKNKIPPKWFMNEILNN